MQSVSPRRTLVEHNDFSNFCALSGPPWIAVSTGDDRRVNISRLERADGDSDFRATLLQRLPDTAWKCSITEDGDIAAAACNDGAVRIWRTRDGKRLHTLRQRGFDCAFGVALSASANFLVATFFDSTTENGVMVRFILSADKFSRSMGQTSWRLPLAWNHASVSISRHAEVVSVASNEGLRVFNGYYGTLLFEYSDLSRDFDVSISAAGRRVAVADKHNLRVFYQSSPAVWRVRTYDGYESPLTPACAISADGQTVIAAMEDGTFRAWNVSHRFPLLSLEGHAAPGRGCAISKDGAVAITTSVDRTVKFWNLVGPETSEENAPETSSTPGEDKKEEERQQSIPAPEPETESSDDTLPSDPGCEEPELLTPDSSAEKIELTRGEEFNARLQRANTSLLNSEGSSLAFALKCFAGDLMRSISREET